MEVQVKVLSQVQKTFLRRKARLWTLLGRSKPGRERGLADTGAMVCTAGQDIVRAMWLQVDILAKTKMVVQGVQAHSVGGSGGGDISRGQNIIPDWGCHRGNQTADIITDVPGTAGGGVQGLLHQQKKGRC